MVELSKNLNKKHIGLNVQRIRVYLGVKQEALAADLGISQQEVSKIEQEDEIGEGLLTQIAGVLGVSTEVIKNFNVERAICNINHNYQDAASSEGGTVMGLQINPIEKIVELYKRLLQSEKEKIELLKNR